MALAGLVEATEAEAVAQTASDAGNASTLGHTAHKYRTKRGEDIAKGSSPRFVQSAGEGKFSAPACHAIR